jgi:hypothetical protein
VSRSTRRTQIPQEFLNIYDLGQPRQFFVGQHARLPWQRWLGFWLTAAGLICLLWGIWQSGVRISIYGPADFWKAGAGPLILGGGLILAALAWYLVTRQPNCPDLMVYEQGLAAIQNGELSLWPWEDFASLTLTRERRTFLGVNVSIQQEYLLVDKRGNQLLINDCTKGAEALLEILHERVLPVLLERSQRSFQQDHSLRFGQVELERSHGLRITTTWYPWEQVRKLWVERGYLWLRVQTPQGEHEHRVPVGKIANLEVLLALAASQTKFRVGE